MLRGGFGGQSGGVRHCDEQTLVLVGHSHYFRELFRNFMDPAAVADAGIDASSIDLVGVVAGLFRHPNPGRAIGDALGLAIKRLRERPASSRIFILLTDGQDTASTVDPMEAAALAAQLDVKIYTIGISRNLGRTANGRSEVDEAMLNAVAEATGGRYFRATSPAQLEAVYALLEELEPVEQEASTFRPKRALSWMPLLAALMLASLLALLRSRWLSRLGMRPRYG